MEVKTRPKAGGGGGGGRGGLSDGFLVSAEERYEGNNVDEMNESSLPDMNVEFLDTHERPSSDGKASEFSAFANIINSFFGSGVLGLPYAFKMAGITAGMITLTIVAIISRYCMHILLQCRHLVKEKDPSIAGSYGDIAFAAYGQRGRQIVDCALSFTQLGFCTVYMIFLGDNLNDIHPGADISTYITICFLFLSVICLARSLSWLSPFSVIAELSTIGGLLIINTYGLYQLRKNGWHTDDIVTSVRPLTFPIFFGICTASYEGIGLVIPIQASMKEPEKYHRILNVAMVLLSVFFLMTGINAYICFGDHTASIISLNLPETGLASFVKFTLCIAIFFTYPIQMFPVFEIVERYFFPGTTGAAPSNNMKKHVIRVCLVFLTAFLAILIPHFGAVIGLVGSIGASLLAYILPTIFYMELFRNSITRRLRLMLMGVLVFGVFGGLAAALTVLTESED